jgi:tRNA pseudouridine55 synthase
MASGVLVVLVGEATKLAPFLTAHEKSYEAVVVLGRATDTLDAQGAITSEAPVPDALRAEITRAIEHAPSADVEADAELARIAPVLHAALASERARTEQTPPAYSAVKVGGRRSYDRARAGEAVDLSARPVAVRTLRILPSEKAPAMAGAGLLLLPLELDVTKGYYVRSLARDLGERLGVPASLASLRRTRSGPFTLASAVPLDAAPGALAQAVIPLASAAAASLAAARLTEDGAARARAGQRLHLSDFEAPPPSGGEPSAWLDPSGDLVVVGAMEHGQLVILRGFAKEGGRS